MHIYFKINQFTGGEKVVRIQERSSANNWTLSGLLPVLTIMEFYDTDNHDEQRKPACLIIRTIVPFYLEVVVSKQWSRIVPLDSSARIPPGPPMAGVTGKLKGENMKSKVIKSMITFNVLVLFVMIWVFVACAANSGAPEVKKDTTPIPKSGILSITFLGNKKFTSEQLQKVVDGTELKLGGVVGPAVIGPAMTALVDFYKKNGANLSISPDIIEDPKGITFVQFIIDEAGTGGDIGGLVSSGGPQIFCESSKTKSAGGAAAGGGAAPGGAQGGAPGGAAPGGAQGGAAPGGAQGGAPSGAAPGGAAQGGAPGGAAPGGAATETKKDTTPIPASGVLSITFLGNKKFTSEQLQKVVDGTELKLGGKVNAAIIGPAMTALVDFYKKNGVKLNISPDIIEDPKGIAFVQFIIDEAGTKGDIGGLVSSGGPQIFCK